MSQDFQARFIQDGKAIGYTPGADVAAGKFKDIPSVLQALMLKGAAAGTTPPGGG